MSIYGGFRTHKVQTGTTGDLDRHGAYTHLEVEAATNTLFYPNALLDDGQPNPRQPDGIPIKAGVTRIILMQVYNWKADAAVTVVAYRM